jgi:CheY-like chemotaxis protein
VDDRADSRRLIVRLLQPLGFEVREAADGRQALEQWRQWKPHLLLMAMRMPVMDGRAATRRIKAEPGGAETVIVALTASSFEDEREAILACGCDAFLRKPFHEHVLLDLIERHLPVRYEREAPVARPGSAAHVGDDALASLPELLREALCNALDRLDVNAIDQAIAAVAAHDAALGRRLGEINARFDYARLRAMLSVVRGEVA